MYNSRNTGQFYRNIILPEVGLYINYLQVTDVSYHVSQECIASNVEWHAKTLGEKIQRNQQTPKQYLSSIGMVQWAWFNRHGSMGMVQWAWFNGHGSTGMLQWACFNGHGPLGAAEWMWFKGCGLTYHVT